MNIKRGNRREKVVWDRDAQCTRKNPWDVGMGNAES